MGNEVFTDEGLLIGFLQERYRNRGPSWFHRAWENGTLPDPDVLAAGRSTVTIFTDQLKQFRDDYAMVVAFAAHVCRVPLQDFSPSHMLRYFEKRRAGI